MEEREAARVEERCLQPRDLQAGIVVVDSSGVDVAVDVVCAVVVVFAVVGS